MRYPIVRSFLIMLLFVGFVATPATARDRDPLAPVEEMEAHQFEAFPEDIVSPDNANEIVALVNEARLFGVPVSVRVVELPTNHSALSQFDDVDTSSPIPNDIVHEMAQAWMQREPVESSPGADDGFLMFVVMPEDRTLSNAVIEMGPNALPLNGLTQENIDAVLTDLVMPRFANDEISQGIRIGMSVFSYNNLFGEPERIRLDDLHQDLQAFAGIPLAGMTAVSGLGLVGLAAWINRRRTSPADEARGMPVTSFGAAALKIGRVNDAVVTGALLHLIRIGALIPGKPDDFSLRLAPNTPPVDDPFATSVLDILRQHADSSGMVSDAATRHVHDLMAPVRSGLEDDLARQGFFNKDGRIEHWWLILASLLVGAIALFTLLPSILGMARSGIFAIVFAALCIAGVLIWSSRRSWTTDLGEQALATWAADASLDDRATFDTIVNQDALISAQGGPIVPETVSLVRDLRGIGAT